MVGAAPETRSGAAAIVEHARAHGLFSRWPISYVATHGDGSLIDNGVRFAGALRDFTALLARERRLAVHLHLSASRAIDQVFGWAAVAARCPLVVQLHGQGFEASIRRLLERAAVVGVPCESMRLWLRSVAKNADVMILPPPAAVMVEVQPSTSNLVLFLGSLEARNGIYDLLDAVARVRAAVPDVRLVCAGEGDRVGVARYARSLGIVDAVKFTGWVGPSGKRALLESAAVFALPSYEQALPVSLIEAMSAGIPVIGSPVGGVPEAVLDGVNGFLVAPGDRAGLERALRRLLVDRALAERMGAAARESARLRYAPERALAPLERLYDSLGVAASVERAPSREDELKKAA